MQQEADVTPQTFAILDLRIGVIKQCWKHPQSQKLYCEKIEVFEAQRQIASGLQQFVPIEKMTGKIVVMANLKARKLAGFMSDGMVVCASTQDRSKIELLIPNGQPNQRLKLQGYQQLFKDQRQPVTNPKKKILEKCAPFLKTDEQGYVTWKGIKLKTSGGYIQSTIVNGNVS